MNAVWGSVSSGTDTHGHAAHPAGYFEQPAQVKSPQDRAELLSLQRTATANLAEVHKMRVALRQIADKGKRADLERDIATLMKHPGGSAGAAVLGVQLPWSLCFCGTGATIALLLWGLCCCRDPSRPSRACACACDRAASLPCVLLPCWWADFNAKKLKEKCMEDHGAQLQPPAWDMLMIGEERTHSTAHDPAHTCLYNIWKRLLKEVLIPKQLPAKDPFAKGCASPSTICICVCVSVHMYVCVCVCVCVCMHVRISGQEME
jgi:hypothetical protein